MKRRMVLGLVTGIIGVLTIPARAAPPTEVSIKDRQYNPPSISVPLGGTVRWTNDETGSLLSPAPSHTVTSDGGDFQSGVIRPGGNYRVRFQTAGTFTYHCEIHSTMHGLVIVGGQSTPTPTVSASPRPTSTATAKPSPRPTRTATRKASPTPTPSISEIAQAAPRVDGSSSAGTIISVAIASIAALIGLAYFVYLRFLRAPL